MLSNTYYNTERSFLILYTSYRIDFGGKPDQVVDQTRPEESMPTEILITFGEVGKTVKSNIVGILHHLDAVVTVSWGPGIVS